MNRRTVRSVFLFFIFFLPFQYGIIGLVSLYDSEPWPAFIFPGFKNVYVYQNDVYRVSDLEFHYYRDGYDAPVQFLHLQLFSEIPRSQVQGFLRTNFMEEERIRSFDTSTRRWLHDRANRYYPGQAFTRMEILHVDYFYRSSAGRAMPDSTVETKRIPIYF